MRSVTATVLTAALAACAFAAIALFTVAEAQIVADPGAPGNQRPTILAAPNGVPMANITTPSAAGVSRNNYTQFDVAPQGAILNNSRTNVKTQLGGWVPANAALAGGSARVILNEVNSVNPSQLRGYVEVAGQRADVVISNPAGITVNGGGFINADRVTLTTGTPVINSGNGGSLDSYRVQRGTVVVEGLGLDTRTASYTDILARAVQVNAGIWAQQLNVTTGANEVNAANPNVATPIAGTEAAPTYMLDIAALGGMYAGKIYLLGTEAGLGSRNAGVVNATGGDFVLLSNGWLTNQGVLQASGNAQITTAGTVTNNATVYANGNTLISAQGGISNTGTLAAQGNTTLQAIGAGTQITSTAGSVVAAGLNPDGTVATTGNLNVAALGAVSLNGQSVAGGDAAISGAQLNLTDGKFSAHDLSLSASTGGIDASRATVSASGALTATTSQTLRTDGAQVSAGQLNLTAQDISNVGGQITQTGTGNAIIGASGSLNNTDGKITSNGSTAITAPVLTNTRGQITAVQSTNVTAATQLNNNDGRIAAGQHLAVAGGSISNLGTGRLEGNTASVTASQNLGNSGTIIATGQLDVAATGTLDNTGRIASQQTTVQAATLNNQASGRIEGNALTVTANTVNNNGGGIVGDTVTVNAATLNNQGASALIAGTSRVFLYVRNTLNNTGSASVYSLGDLDIAANSSKDASGTLLNRTTLVNNETSLLQADGNMQIAAETLVNTRAAPQVTTTTSTTTKTLLKRSGYWMCEYGNYIDSFAGYCAGGYASLSWYDPAIHINPLAEKPGVWIGGHAVETERVTTTTVTDTQLQGALQPEPKVLVGNNLILRNVGNLRNEYGSIMAGGNATIGNADPLGSYQTASVINTGVVLNRDTLVDEYSVFRWNRNYGAATTQSLAPQASTAVIGRVGGTLSAGGIFAIYAGSVVNNNALPGQSNASGAATPGPAGSAFILPSLASLSAAAGVVPGLPGALTIPPPRNPSQTYLIESDPRFASYKNWLSSDYMLTALSYDPATLQKRLGDGFFEQKLIRDQVGQLTGRRFLDGYASEEVQYQALMASAVTVAQQWNLRPGIALTAEQVASLTSDMVWLVEQDVTLTDGRTTKALVPVVYLSQVHTADLRPTGALILARSVDIHAKGDLSNNGALQAQDRILLAANKVSNELGLIDASRGATTIVSDTDIINRSGMISGNSVRLNAARDIRIDAVTRQFNASRGTVAGDVSGSNTQVGPLGSVVSRGDLSINAQRDVLLAGAVIGAQGNASISAGNNLVVDTIQTRQSTLDVSSSGVRQTQGTTHISSSLQTGGNLSLSSGGDTTLTAAQVSAGRDLSVMSRGNLSINAATDTAQLDENMRAKGYVRNDHAAQERVIGSKLVAGSNVTLAAVTAAPDGSQGNLTVQGSSVNAVGGQLSMVAAGNVNIVEARQKNEYDLFNETKGSKTFSSKTQTAHDTGSADMAVGSSLSGKEVSIVSGKDLTVRGSSVVSDDAITLTAKNNITIEAAHNSETSSSFREEKKSGLMSSGGIGFTVGKREQSTGQQTQTSTASASTVGAIAGNVTIIAGNQYKQVGSDVIAPGGDINILAKNVQITEARETSQSATEQKFKQSGLTLAVTSPVISAIQTVQQMSQAAGDTSDGRMQALAAANSAFAAKNAANAIQAGQLPKPTGGNNPSANTDVEPSAADKAGGINLAISIGGSSSQSTGTGQSDTARGSTVKAGGNITIAATGGGQDSNLTIQGSTVEAGKSALLFADNQIKLLAAQNIASQNSSNSSSSGSIGVSFGTDGFLINASASKGRGNADGVDTSYTNSQVKAGNSAGNTVTLISGGDTTLKGAVVAANQVKADVGGNLSIESLQDTSTYTGKQQNFGGSISVGWGNMSGSISASKNNIDSNYQSVTQQSGIKAGDGGFQVEVQGNTDLKGAVIASTDRAVNDGNNSFITGGTLTTSDMQNKASYSGKSVGVSVGGGYKGSTASLNGTGVGIGSDKGDASSTSSAGISGIAGNTAVRSTDPETGIAKIFDADKVQREINAQMQITKAFSKEAPKAVASFAASQSKDLREQAKAEPDAGKKAALEAEAAKWDEGGMYRIALHTATGALGGGLSGAAGAAASSSAANLMNELQSNIQQGLQTAGLSAEAAKIIAQGVTGLTAAGMGAAVGGAQGAASALTVDANNRQLHPNERSLIEKLAKDKATQECRGNAQCETQTAVKWTDLMERAAEGQTDSREYEKNLQYLTALAQAAAQSGSEGATGGVERYLNDLKTAQAMLSPYTGQTITVNGRTMTANGAPQTYFSATPEQRSNPYANTLLGQLPSSIIVGMDQRDQKRLEQMIAQNGTATPSYPVEELLLGGAIGSRALTAIGRALGEVDVFLAGRATASSGGNISTKQITEEALPVRLSAGEQATLRQLDSLPNTNAQGLLREYIVDSYFTRNGFTQLEGKCGSGNCFDGVYVKGDKVYINEVKPLNNNGSIKLSGPSGNMETQMSDIWIQSALTRLEASGTPDALRTAAVVHDAIRRETLIKVVSGVNQNGMSIIKLK